MNFAEKEFKNYWEKTVGGDSGVKIGLFSPSELKNYKVKESDDAYAICINGREGSIKASNECAVLIAVYAFYFKLGCRFVQPNVDVLVKANPQSIRIKEFKKAANLFRGVTIEGATSIEQLLNLIDWLPKVGFNTYFTQFQTSYEFFERWYSHKYNPSLSPEPFNMEQATAYYESLKGAIALRGIKHHAVGHGWTCESLGVASVGWRKMEGMAEELKPLIASVDGKREFFKGIPLNTNLCYSNPEAMDRFCEQVISYAEKNVGLDFLHIWLADDYNNFCDCAACSKKSPTDWYLTILNRVDAALTERKLGIKIVFLIYYELMWPPQTVELLNQDRFVLMFAPISRSYAKSFASAVNLRKTKGLSLKQYEFNKIKPSANLEINLSYLFAWKKHFNGKCFVFDYHLMWDINKELSGLRLSKVIYDDIRFYERIGLDGYLSCQLQRAFFPLGLPFYLMGRCLFDGKVSYKAIKKEYFTACYGKYTAVETLFEEVRQNLPHEYFRCEISEINPMVALNAEKLRIYLTMQKDKFNTFGITNKLFSRQLEHAINMYILYCGAIKAKAEGQPDEVIAEKAQVLEHYIQVNEQEFQTIVDVYYFVFTINEFLKNHWTI